MCSRTTGLTCQTLVFLPAVRALLLDSLEAWTIDPSANGHTDLETLAWMNDDLAGWPRWIVP